MPFIVVLVIHRALGQPTVREEHGVRHQRSIGEVHREWILEHVVMGLHIVVIVVNGLFLVQAPLLRSATSSINIDDGKGIGSSILVQHHGWLVLVFTEMQLERVAILGSVVAISTPVLVNVGVRLEMRVEHGLVDAGVGALGTLERLAPHVVPLVVFHVMFVLGDKWAFGTVEHSFWLDVTLGMFPEVHLCDGNELALLAFESLDFPVGVDSGDA